MAVRSAGSHGVWDVIAISPLQIELVQVKTFTKKPGNYKRDIEKLKALEVPDCVVKKIMIWQHGKGWWKIEEVNG